MGNLHGIKVNEITTGTRPINPVSTAVIGIVVTASDEDGDKAAALNLAFPLNTPVLITDVRAAIGKAGSGGTLRPTLEAIADQCSPVIVVVRAEIGADDDATQTNVIGGNANGEYTGIAALLTAETVVGTRPRILGAPGLDSEDVIVALLPIAKKLRGMVYARCAGDTVAEAIVNPDSYAARELCLIWPSFVHDFAGDTIARALGLRARIDEETGWHKSISNVALSGVTGIDKDVTYDQLGGDNDAKLLNDAKITTLIRREGYRFWGNRTMSAEPLFAFETATRTAQVLQDEMAAGLAWAIDKPMTKVLVDDTLETIKARFRALVSAGKIIGANAWYDPALNPQEQLAAGQLDLDYDFTPVAPLEGLTLNQRITDTYYASFSDPANS